jgi:hypothetical protein
MFRAPKVKAPKVRKLSTKTPEVPKAPTVPAMNAPTTAAISSSEMPEVSDVSATVPLIEVQAVPEVSIGTPTKTKQVPAFTTKSSPKTSLSWWEHIKTYLIPKRSRPFSANYGLSVDANKLFKAQSTFAWKVKELIEKSSAREAVANIQRFAHAEGTQQFPTEKEAIEIVAKAAEQDIQKAHEQHNLPFVEKGLMVCTPPGINSALLLEFDSIEKIQAVFKEQYRLLDLEYKKIENMDDATFNGYVAKKKRDRNYLENTYYKQPCDLAVHDMELPPFILEETRRILTLVGINPLSVSILTMADDNRGAAGGARGPSISIKNGVMDVEEPAVIFYNMSLIKRLDHKSIVFLIAHEIGHLLCNHVYLIQEYPQAGYLSLFKAIKWTAQKRKAAKKLKHKINLFNELEADVTVALLNKEVAQVIHEHLLEVLAIPHTDNTFPTNVMLTNIHPSSNVRYLWIQRINDLHKKRAQQPTP